MRFCLIGLPQSGKTSLFSAVVEAGGSSVDTSRPDQPHTAMVKVPEARIDYLSQVYDTKKTVYTEIELMDLPGFDLSDDAGRDRAKTHWSAMKQCEMLVFVVRAFNSDDVPVYGGSVEPSRDINQLLDEMLFADLEQVTNRVEKLEKSITRPTPDRDKQIKELEIMKRIHEALENEQPASSVIKSPAEEK